MLTARATQCRRDEGCHGWRRATDGGHRGPCSSLCGLYGPHLCSALIQWWVCMHRTNRRGVRPDVVAWESDDSQGNPLPLNLAMASALFLVEQLVLVFFLFFYFFILYQFIDRRAE